MTQPSKNNRRTRKHAKPPADLTGRRFGKWLVLKDAGIGVYYSGAKRVSQHMWLCRCDCGVQQQVSVGNLTRGLSTRCSECRFPRHRLHHPKLYVAWTSLKRRGQFPEEWRDFDVFRKAVGDPPDNEVRLTRHDLTKPHSPENTLWAAPTRLREIRRKFKEGHVAQNTLLMKIRTAKSRDETVRCMVAARMAGYSYGMIGIAAGITRQRVQQVIDKRTRRLGSNR